MDAPDNHIPIDALKANNRHLKAKIIAEALLKSGQTILPMQFDPTGTKQKTIRIYLANTSSVLHNRRDAGNSATQCYSHLVMEPPT